MQDLTPFMNKYILICIIALLSLAYPPFLYAKSSVRVSFSSQSLKQGEVLLVNVTDKNGINTLSGTMFNKPVHFYKNSTGKKYTALVGIDMDTKPDFYKLTLNIEEIKEKLIMNWYRFNITTAD